MAVIIQTRNDTAANWTLSNPILANGEMGYESDTGQAKFGNGVDTWGTLPYFAGSVSGGITDALDGGAAASIYTADEEITGGDATGQ